ncbi:MAG: hypothetical protein DWQ35_13830 [Planctomycetota bacterium]|nr:MAG: hypothetical protein DWQ35_13830 [Planctomycetota bacterium]REK25978.1 MAG: hypothetical protein DWQ42_10130 [Planctomycetota bacterium]REK46907.1 MAG: hypothetical protein DWQ46_05275 [Planctomycetota bacterium]
MALWWAVDNGSVHNVSSLDDDELKNVVATALKDLCKEHGGLPRTRMEGEDDGSAVIEISIE